MQTDRRIDFELADAIDEAIALDSSKGAVHAWLALSQLGVDEATIKRLLAIDSDGRRSSVYAKIRPTPRNSPSSPHT